MKIISNLCKKCGKCKTECHRRAIIETEDGTFTIEESLCNDCNDLYEVQCTRVCPYDCIVKSDYNSDVRKPFSLDNTIRVRPDHLLYIIAILGSKGEERYVNGREWSALRSVISKSFENPQLTIRIVPFFDDACIGCQMKCNEEHIKIVKWEDNETASLMGFKFGEVVRFWDVVRLVKEKVTAEYLRSIKKPESLIKDFFA